MPHYVVYAGVPVLVPDSVEDVVEVDRLLANPQCKVLWDALVGGDRIAASALLDWYEEQGVYPCGE